MWRLPRHSFKKDILEIAAGIEESKDINQLFVDTVDDSPGRDNNFVIILDPMRLKFRNNTATLKH